MDKFRYLKWPVYQDAQELFNLIIEITNKLPEQIKFSLSNQLTRASFSIILNIAEGCGRDTDKELNRFFDIAIGSSYEVLAATDTLYKQEYISDEDMGTVFGFIDSITDQLGGFKKTI